MLEIHDGCRRGESLDLADAGEGDASSGIMHPCMETFMSPMQEYLKGTTEDREQHARLEGEKMVIGVETAVVANERTAVTNEMISEVRVVSETRALCRTLRDELEHEQSRAFLEPIYLSIDLR